MKSKIELTKEQQNVIINKKKEYLKEHMNREIGDLKLELESKTNKMNLTWRDNTK